MEPVLLSVHPVYGAIYKDGEFVQRGAVLGLSVDSREVVVAPVSGWVRLIDETQARPSPDPLEGLRVEIWQRAEEEADASMPN